MESEVKKFEQREVLFSSSEVGCGRGTRGEVGDEEDGK